MPPSVRRVLIRILAVAGCVSIGLAPAPSALAHTTELDFAWKDHQSRGPHHLQDNGGWAAIARDRDELRDIWDRYRQTGELPTIRFEENIAVIAGLGGGGCGTGLHGLKLNREKRRIAALLFREDPGPGYACTDQYVQETFTLSVQRVDLRGVSVATLRVLPRVIQDPSPGS